MATQNRLLEAIQSDRHVQGYTHRFYRYPAATSPEIVRELLLRYSEPGDWILDPFMGGGTSVVEAIAHGRRAVGSDLNQLAVFVTRAKTTPLTRCDQASIRAWLKSRPLHAGGRGAVTDLRAQALPTKLRMPLRSALSTLGQLDNARQSGLARCALLRTAQWALETRDDVPPPKALHAKLADTIDHMLAGLDSLATSARDHGMTRRDIAGSRILVAARADEAATKRKLQGVAGRIRLVVTSPPYPGVHVLYHRWQVRSRQETAAPYWIADRRDGFTPSYYTMGGRTEIGLVRYFAEITRSFAAIRPLLADDALVVQTVAFSRPDEQLPLFRAAMRKAGYAAATPPSLRSTDLARRVPNRRWYAREQDHGGSREHLLFHHPV